MEKLFQESGSMPGPAFLCGWCRLDTSPDIDHCISTRGLRPVSHVRTQFHSHIFYPREHVVVPGHLFVWFTMSLQWAQAAIPLCYHRWDIWFCVNFFLEYKAMQPEDGLTLTGLHKDILFHPASVLGCIWQIYVYMLTTAFVLNTRGPSNNSLNLCYVS